MREQGCDIREPKVLQIRIWVFGVSPAEPPDRRKALSDIEELRGTMEELTYLEEPWRN